MESQRTRPSQIMRQREIESKKKKYTHTARIDFVLNDGGGAVSLLISFCLIKKSSLCARAEGGFAFYYLVWKPPVFIYVIFAFCSNGGCKFHPLPLPLCFLA